VKNAIKAFVVLTTLAFGGGIFAQTKTAPAAPAAEKKAEKVAEKAGDKAEDTSKGKAKAKAKKTVKKTADKGKVTDEKKGAETEKKTK